MQVRVPKRGEKGNETKISVGTMLGFVITEQATCIVACGPRRCDTTERKGGCLQSLITLLTTFTFLIN